MRDLPPASKCCRWEEEMTRDLFPCWPARMLHRTEWRQTGGERQEEACCRLKSGWPWWRDVITVAVPSSSQLHQCPSSVAGPFLDLLAAWHKNALFLCGVSAFSLRFLRVRAERSEFCTYQSLGLTAACVLGGEVGTSRLMLEKKKLERVYWRPQQI